MTVRTSALIHFDEGDVKHHWHPGSDDCHAYGALKFDNGASGATVFFEAPGQIDKVIAALVALRAEMTGEAAPEGGGPREAQTAPLCDSSMPLPNGGELKCTLDEGHHSAHSALGGKRRWLGHGADARTEEGDLIAVAPKCRACEIEPAAEGDFCEACAPAVLLATGSLEAEPVACGSRPYPAGSEGDDGTECGLPVGHDGPHDDGVSLEDAATLGEREEDDPFIRTRPASVTA